MSQNKHTNSRHSPKLKLCGGALIYGILYVYALIMTQLLQNPISAVFFWFMVIAAPLSFVLMLIGKSVIQVYVHSEVARCEKHTPVEYELRIINQSPIIYPFVEAFVSEPSQDGIRSEKKRLVLSMTPFGGYIVKEKVAFRYRGFYEIGVSELYITDALRLFRLRVDVDNYSNITVLPRRLELTGNGMNSVSDIPSRFTRTIDVRDMSEVNNIRDYRIGDALKTVHWKLSSKSEDLQVKEYNTNNDSHTYILIDTSAPTPVPELERAEAKKKLTELLKAKKKQEQKENPITAFFKSVNAKINKKRYQRKRAKGQRAVDIESKTALDAFIRETSAHGRKVAAKKQAKAYRRQIIEDNEATIARLTELVKEGEEKTSREKLEEAVSRWGGAVIDDFATEMPEYTVDSAIEIATALVTNEISAMHNCTVLCHTNDGILACDIKDASDFDDFYAKVATVPVVGYEKSVSDLVSCISESVNVTIKIITSNLDPLSVGKYSSVPSYFGGAGVGCSTEILHFNTTDKYKNKAERAEYISNAALQLKQYGIDLFSVCETVEGNKTILETSDFN